MIYQMGNYLDEVSVHLGNSLRCFSMRVSTPTCMQPIPLAVAQYITEIAAMLYHVVSLMPELKGFVIDHRSPSDDDTQTSPSAIFVTFR